MKSLFGCEFMLSLIKQHQMMFLFVLFCVVTLCRGESVLDNINDNFINENEIYLSNEDLINKAIEYPRTQFWKDEETLKSLGIDPLTIHPDIIRDSFLLTVIISLICKAVYFLQNLYNFDLASIN